MEKKMALQETRPGSNRKVIVLTPVRNEAWVLESFLRAASVYADHIIISDQNSSDESVTVALKFPKVHLIRNQALDFNELERAEQLLKAARSLGSGNILIALDADEFLTPNFYLDGHLEMVKGLPEGTAVEIPLANVRPDLRSYWQVKLQPVVFIDNGEANQDTSEIHRRRLPTLAATSVISLRQVKVLHLQFIDWSRMESKHRWYQMFEKLKYPLKSDLAIYRQYHHMYSIRRSMLRELPASWTLPLQALGIELDELSKSQESYWWDAECIRLIESHGPAPFRKLDIWRGFPVERPSLSRPERLLLSYLEKTQRFLNLSAPTPLGVMVYLIDKLISRISANDSQKGNLSEH
jgi:glycosyltransferase involved in cell wall biosynthesis